ncbi:AAA family ATPase [Longimycelium tulufanense]|uniref:AAA family ATPase n=1 Tax=Longimycelium tulufanense TaxID=907463 RepID=UPI001E5BB971|nr:AAA family ATPase [Longimycelium tulufanense]
MTAPARPPGHTGTPPRQGPGRGGSPVRQPAAGDSVPAAEPVRRVLLTPASQIRMRPVRWAWTDRIPAGALTVIPGREGIGKSLTLAWLAAQLTRGTLPGQHHGQPRPVIYAATEDSWAHTIGPRLYAAGADLDLVYRVEIEHAAGGVDQLTLPRDCEALTTEIERLGVALLAADPLLSLIHAGIDTHRDRDLRTALEPLARLADATGCAVVGLAHFNKSASNDALNLITGSRAFSAVARAVIAIARDTDTDDGTCIMSQAKNNLGRLDLPSLRYRVDSVDVPTDEGPATVGRLVFLGETDRHVNDILTDHGGTKGTGTKREAAAAWLAEYLTSHGETPSRDVKDAGQEAGFSASTIDRAARSLNVVSTSVGFPSTTVWRLP